MPSNISNPTQLVEEYVLLAFIGPMLAADTRTCRFKKSGEFDRLRRELLTEFRDVVRGFRLGVQ